MRRLLLELLHIMHNTLDAVEVVLDLGGLADQPAKRLLDGDDVAEHEASDTWRYAEAGCHDEDADGEDEEVADEIETGRKPTLVGKREIVCRVHLVNRLA